VGGCTAGDSNDSQEPAGLPGTKNAPTQLEPHTHSSDSPTCPSTSLCRVRRPSVGSRRTVGGVERGTQRRGLHNPRTFHKQGTRIAGHPRSSNHPPTHGRHLSVVVAAFHSPASNTFWAGWVAFWFMQNTFLRSMTSARSTTGAAAMAAWAAGGGGAGGSRTPLELHGGFLIHPQLPAHRVGTRELGVGLGAPALRATTNRLANAKGQRILGPLLGK
jgi:hypothetical protein